MTEAIESIQVRSEMHEIGRCWWSLKRRGKWFRAFDSKVKLRFSSRSEALRSIVRAFLEGEKK